jgi:hypothetical protein
VVTPSGTIDYGLVWGGCGAKVKLHNVQIFKIEESLSEMYISMLQIPDSFKKIIVVGGNSPPDFCSHKLKKLS